MKNIANRMFLMNAAEATATAAGAPATAPAPATRKTKGINVTLSEGSKKWLDDFKSEHSGPSLSDPSKPKFLSSEEAIEVLIQVATDRRHGKRHKVDEKGNQEFDGDGVPVMEDVDFLALAAEEIIANREGTTRSDSAKAKLAKAESELDEVRKTLAALGWTDSHLPTPEELAKLARKRR